MSDYFQEARRKAREDYLRETAHEATDTERGITVGVDVPHATDTRRREAIQALIDRGATEGEREAARAALYRPDHPSTLAHDATERGSYYARDTLAHGGDE